MSATYDVGEAEAVLREEVDRRGALPAPVILEFVGALCRPVPAFVDDVEEVAFESVRRVVWP